jgi:hypothetical protein
MAERVEAGPLWQLETAEQQRDGSRNRVRLQRGAVRVAEDEIALVTVAEVSAVLLLRLAMRLQLLQG